MEGSQKLKFLENAPIGEDLFEGKSQERTADIISQNLQSEKFQIIGIDGSWGTGKSNLVKIVEKKLKSDAFYFFIYDVWGHQEDDQRKAILVELTEFIVHDEKKIVADTKKWDQKLKRLLAKEREITTTNTPYLSVGFIVSLFLIIYIPAVNTFAKDLQYLWLKLLLVLAPILIGLGLYIYKVCTNLKNFKEQKLWQSIKLSLQQMMQVYNNKQVDETKIEAISDKEPSVRDFRNWMDQIDLDLNASNKKLVIVFDNFDRLPRRHIQSIWSSIHVFFSNEKYSNIKVIIPFDREHIKLAFSELNGNNRPSTENTSSPDFASDYINKTFDVVYRIAPPIMSNWKQFFKSNFTDALGELFNEMRYIKTEQVYETFARIITPREIIAFINETVSIKYLHPDIPENYIGIFILNKDHILSNPLKAISNPDFLRGLSYLYKNDEALQKFLAALSYQVDAENALEVVYRQKLKTSLADNNVEEFNNIANTSVFNEIIIPVIEELDDYINPIKCLYKISDTAKISMLKLSTIWSNIYYKQSTKDISEVSFSDATKILLLKVDDYLKPLWLKKVIDDFYKSKEFTTVAFMQAIDDIAAYLKDNELKFEFSDLLITKTVLPKDFIELVRQKKDNYEKYQITTEQAGLDQYLSGLDVDDMQNLDYLKYINSQFSLQLFDAHLKEIITANKSEQKYLGGLFETRRNLLKNKPVGEILLADNEIYTFFSQTNKEDSFYYDLLAMRIARANDFRVSYNSLFSTVMENPDVELIDKLSERIEYYISYGDLLLTSINFSNNAVKGILQNLLSNKYQTQRANIASILKKFKLICDINAIDPQAFINDLNRWELPKFENSLIESIPNFYFTEAMKNESKLAKASIEAQLNYFDTLSKEEWVSIFDSPDDNSFELIGIVEYSNWNSYTLEALNESLKKKIKSGDVKNEQAYNDIISSFAEKQDLTNTFKNIRDEFINNGNMNVNLFAFFGPWLFKYAKLEERSADVLRTILLGNLLDNSNCLHILSANHKAIKTLIENCGQSDSADFKEAIRDRIKNSNVAALAKSIGVGRRKIKTDK